MLSVDLTKTSRQICSDIVKMAKNAKPGKNYKGKESLLWQLVASTTDNNLFVKGTSMGHGIGRRAFMKMGGQAMYRISDFHVPLHSKRGHGDTSTGTETFRFSSYMSYII